MSRPKRLAAPDSPPQPHPRIISVSVSVVVAVMVVGLWWSTSPWRWLRQAEGILARDPAQADELAEAALNAGTGKGSQAWLIRCRAQLALEKPLEALGAYAQIKQPNQCQVADWCALIEEAQAAHHTLLADIALTAALQFGRERARVLTLVLPAKVSTLSEKEATELVQELRRLSGSRAECWRAVGITEQALGRFTEAVEAYRQAVAQSSIAQPIGLSSRRELAQLLIILGQFSAAEPLVTEVLHGAVALIDDQLRLAQLKRSRGDRDGAEQLLNEVLEKDRENLPALLLRGTVRAEQEQLATAQSDFERCLQIAPHHDEAHYRLSQILRRQGDSSGATKHLQENRRLSELKRRMLEINTQRETAPQDPQLMDELADLFEALGQPRTSAEWHRAAQTVRGLQKSEP